MNPVSARLTELPPPCSASPPRISLHTYPSTHTHSPATRLHHPPPFKTLAHTQPIYPHAESVCVYASSTKPCISLATSHLPQRPTHAHKTQPVTFRYARRVSAPLHVSHPKRATVFSHPFTSTPTVSHRQPTRPCHHVHQRTNSMLRSASAPEPKIPHAHISRARARAQTRVCVRV